MSAGGESPAGGGGRQEESGGRPQEEEGFVLHGRQLQQLPGQGERVRAGARPAPASPAPRERPLLRPGPRWVPPGRPEERQEADGPGDEEEDPGGETQAAQHRPPERRQAEVRGLPGVSEGPPGAGPPRPRWLSPAVAASQGEGQGALGNPVPAGDRQVRVFREAEAPEIRRECHRAPRLGPVPPAGRLLRPHQPGPCANPAPPGQPPRPEPAAPAPGGAADGGLGSGFGVTGACTESPVSPAHPRVALGSPGSRASSPADPSLDTPTPETPLPQSPGGRLEPLLGPGQAGCRAPHSRLGPPAGTATLCRGRLTGAHQ